MPKIFLIKNRLHQQQQRLLESQNLLQDKNEDDRLVPPLSPSPPVDNGKPSTPPGVSRSYTPPTRHVHSIHSGFRAHTTPTPPPPATVPAPVQPPKTPEPLGKAETATPLLVAKRSISPTTTATTTVPTEIEEAQTANVPSAEPVNLLVKPATETTATATTTETAETAETTAPNTPPLSRKRFHHRRYYFGQQQLQLQQQQQQEKKLLNGDKDADAAEGKSNIFTQLSSLVCELLV